MLCPKKTKWVKSRLPLTLETVWANFLKTKFKTDIFTIFLKIKLRNTFQYFNIAKVTNIKTCGYVPIHSCFFSVFKYSRWELHLLFSIFFCRTRNLTHNCSYFYHSSGYAEVNFGHLWWGSLAWHKIITQLPKCLSRGHLEFSNKAESFSPT